MAGARTHLLLGQVDAAVAPSSAAGALYSLSDGYGMPAGTDTRLIVESPDVAPVGELGRMRLRLVSCLVQYDAACELRVTPIVDYMDELAGVTVALPAPSVTERHAVQVKLSRVCTTVRVRLEVLARSGLVEFYTPTLFYAPLTGQSGVAMGEAP